MRNTTRPRTPADDLRVVLEHWQHMRDLIDTATPAAWPPAMGHAQYLRALDDHDAAEVARDRDRLVLAETPAPLRLHVVDACRAVEVVLAAVADEIAAEVQRPVMSGPDPQWPEADRARRRALVEADAADPRRWHYTLGDRTAPAAAAWLLARIEGPSGICERITLEQRDRIGRVAAEAARRVEQTIGVDRRTADLDDDRPCPWCSGRLTMHRDAARGEASVTCANGLDCSAPVRVESGRRVWSTPHELLELRKALDVAERRRRRRDAKRAERARRRVA